MCTFIGKCALLFYIEMTTSSHFQFGKTVRETLPKFRQCMLIDQSRRMKRKAHIQQTFANQLSFEKYGRKSRREEFQA